MSKPIFYFYLHNGVDVNHSEDSVNIERIWGMRYQDTDMYPQLSVRLFNGFIDSFSRYPNWIINWKNSYLEVEESCTFFNSSTNRIYCKIGDSEKTVLIIS